MSEFEKLDESFRALVQAHRGLEAKWTEELSQVAFERNALAEVQELRSRCEAYERRAWAADRSETPEDALRLDIEFQRLQEAKDIADVLEEIARNTFPREPVGEQPLNVFDVLIDACLRRDMDGLLDALIALKAKMRALRRDRRKTRSVEARNAEWFKEPFEAAADSTWARRVASAFLRAHGRQPSVGDIYRAGLDGMFRCGRIGSGTIGEIQRWFASHGVDWGASHASPE